MMYHLIIGCVLTMLSGEAASIYSQNHHVPVRLKRQADNTAMLVSGIKDFILTGGIEQVANSQDKTNALMNYIQGYALRRVLGDGVVGQVLGRGLLGKSLPTTAAPISNSGGGGILDQIVGAALGITTTTTTPKPGFFDRLFGRNKNTNNDKGAESLRNSVETTPRFEPETTTSFLSSLWNKVKGGSLRNEDTTTSTTTTTTTTQPETTKSFLGSVWSKIKNG